MNTKGGTAKPKILTIFIIMLLASFFLKEMGLTYVKFKKEEVVKKWDVYKCSPIIIPIADKIKPGIDKSMLQQECFSKFFISLFNGKILSQMPIFGMIERTLGESNNQMSFFDKFFDEIGSFFDAATTTLYEKIENFMQVIIFSFLKIKNIFGRIQASMRLQLYALEAIQMTLISIWEGPIGKGTRDFGDVYDTVSDFFDNILNPFKKPMKKKAKEGFKEGCFTSETVINGTPICDIKPDYNNILGMVKIENKDDIYNYNDVNVSGSHYVLFYGKYTQIAQLGLDKTSRNDDVLYCPITESRHINIGDSIFLDYMEINNNIYLRHLLRLINNKQVPFKNNSRFAGMGGNTKIRYYNNTYRPINECNIGDILYNNNRVIGVVKLVPKDTTLYKFKDTIISGRQIIYHKNIWRNLETIINNEDGYIIDNSGDSYIYSLITQNNTIQTQNILVRDFEELNDDIMSTLVNNMLNNNKCSID